ncbi:MAG: hypothetical protein KGH62_04915, partial [Candidatus Micrarchaeota archaeon]|nr:hypothetical protein [Candidatus Micrarchaeota archaeon]
IKNIPEIILLYGALSFVTSASATPLNLLVMETSTQNKWTNKFSNLQMMASGGITIGLVIASLITGISTLENLILILSAFSFISFILALRLIKEPKRPIPKREPFTNGINSFISRLVTVPSLMIRIPHTGNIKNIFRFKGIKGTERNFLITFYLITFVFYLGTSIFSTAYPVSLRMYGLSQSYIFFVILMGMIVQTLVFHYYNYFAKGSSRRFIAYGSLLLRGASYLMIGTMFLPVFGVIFNLGNLLFYCLASGVAYAIYYTISYAIFFDTITGKTRGSTVGIYGSLAGVGTFGGALLSGALVVTHGYMITFAIAGLLMILCAFLFRVLPRLH